MTPEEILNDRINALRADFRLLEDRLEAVEERAVTNMKLGRANRQSQQFLEATIWAIILLIALIIVGLKYQEGAFSFAISAEILIALGSAPILVKWLQWYRAGREGGDDSNS